MPRIPKYKVVSAQDTVGGYREDTISPKAMTFPEAMKYMKAIEKHYGHSGKLKVMVTHKDGEK